ncbi:MAG: Uma2 family endonuclease, partial [Prochloron sp. SP5CPC1]|nr:Uma2 family endonuclease [Candidatus Paraprochloron terpiosi SP5CPC1]
MEPMKINLPERENLPTMYDLPSEEESGLPDEYHLLQSELCRATFFHPMSPDKVFVATDLNLYYDSNNTQWYKRPDWFAVVGVDRLYQKRSLRMSYVIWQEKVAPCIVIEFLSPSTRNEDLGRSKSKGIQPTKWEVYEEILRIPYYIVFDGVTNEI